MNRGASRVHLIARDNGAGLTRDLVILDRALRDAGFDLTVSAIGDDGFARKLHRLRVQAGLAWRSLRNGLPPRFDVNLMDERIRPKYASLARRNVLMPHPEWFRLEWKPYLSSIDRVFAKTRHAVAIFEALGCRAEFVGFTSLDRLRRDIPREPKFFHLGGRSLNKGTQPLIDAWLKHPAWPTLTVVQRAPLSLPPSMPSNVRVIADYLDDDALRVLQNRHLFHLCPSETEGFGHHLVEGLSVGAITLSTDAPPMNEMIASDRGVLVRYVRTGTQQLATTYFVDDSAITNGVERLLALAANERRAMSEAARAWWEANDRDFRQRLATRLHALMDE